MVDRKIAPALSAAFLLLTAACSGDQLASQIAVPPSAEQFDLGLYRGKAIQISVDSEGDYLFDGKSTAYLRVIGSTILLGGHNARFNYSRCALGGIQNGLRMAMLFTVDQPRSDVKVPCEAVEYFYCGSYNTTPAAQVSFSAKASQQGNTLDLSGDLHESNSNTSSQPTGFEIVTTDDVTELFHAKLRLSGDKCELLEFTWMSETRRMQSFAPQTKRIVRKARGCAIVPAPQLL